MIKLSFYAQKTVKMPPSAIGGKVSGNYSGEM